MIFALPAKITEEERQGEWKGELEVAQLGVAK